MKKNIFLFVVILMMAAVSAFAEIQPIKWSRYFRFPSAQENNSKDSAPCLMCCPQFDGSVGFSDYSVDFRTDHFPPDTLIATCCFDIDTSFLLGTYASAGRRYPGVAGHCGFQAVDNDRIYAVMTIWDVCGFDMEGSRAAIIRAEGIGPERAVFERNQDNQGDGAIYAYIPCDLEKGREYRAGVRLHGRRISFYVEDILNQDETLLMEFDVGYDGGFIMSPYAFLQHSGLNAQDAVSSMVLANFRVRDRRSGKMLGTKKAILGQSGNTMGSFTYGAEGNAFYFIASCIPGCCEVPPQYAVYTVTSYEDAASY